jgi:AbrB family looped-hinge helix DNA binding protein
MVYKSTVTSKGTITLPSAIRKSLRIKAGQQVTISANGNGEVVINPGTTFEEFEAIRAKIVAKIPMEKRGLTERALKKAIDHARSTEYERKLSR